MGDYIMNPDGTFQVTDDLTQPAYVRLRCPLGGWMHDPTMGSRFGELVNVKQTPDTRKKVEDYAAEATDPIRQDGRATLITVTTNLLQRGAQRIQVNITDNRARLQQPLALIVPIG